jgi:hypothetical protein
VSNRFNAAVAICESEDDLNMMVDSLARFETCPIVAFLGNVAPPKAFSTSKSFNDVAAAADWVKTQSAATKESIDNVFNQFDKDKNGTIERNEL